MQDVRNTVAFKGRENRVNVVRHDDPGMKPVSVSLKVSKCAFHDLCDLRSLQDHGSPINQRFGELSEVFRLVIGFLESASLFQLCRYGITEAEGYEVGTAVFMQVGKSASCASE